MTDDAELELLMRESLERRAGDVDVAVPVAQRATGRRPPAAPRAACSRRRGRGGGAPLR